LSDHELGLYAERGIMPVLSIKGRDQIRLASFHAVGGQTVFGPWSGPERLDALESKSHEPEFTATLQLVVDAQRTEQELQAAVSKPETSDEDENDASMDNLLASFGENGHDENDADENDEMDAELAALLEGL
jgi:hypothetical protein